MKRVIYVILGLLSIGFIALNALSFYVFGKPETNIRVQSSDGEWADGEVLFKGRDFESLVFTHELYKLACNAPSATIERPIGSVSLIYSRKDWGSVKTKTQLLSRALGAPCAAVSGG